MAVFIAVGPADGELLTIRQNVSGIHVIRKIADIHLCRDELHGNIVADRVDGNGRIFADFACDAVIKTVIQPLYRLWSAGMILRSLKTLHGSGVNAPVEGGVIGPHVIPYHPVELCQGSDGTDIKGIEPAFLQDTEMAFHLALAGAITDLCVKEQNAEGNTDHGQLFI